MNNHNNEDNLRKLFQEQRDIDTARVPSFQRLMRVPVPAMRDVPWLRLATGMALLVAVIMGLMWKPQPVVKTQEWAALSNWRATTDDLVTISSTPWGSSISTLTDSLMEDSTQTTQKRTL